MGISKFFKMVATLSTRKCLFLTLLFVVLLGAYLGVEARGGGRGGGGRGGSRGGSRSRSGSRSSGSKSRASIAASRYRGPKYSSGSWKYAAAAGTLWGLSSYKRRSRYRNHPDREPQVCFNAVNPKQGIYGYFICPEEGQPDSYDYCCGEEGEQRCCGFFDDGGRVAGVVIGVLAACAGIGVGIYCLCTRVLRKKKSADTHGKVIKHEEKTTWNKNNEQMMPLAGYTANDSVTLPSNNMYPSTTEHEVQPAPMGYHTSDGLPYGSNPAQYGQNPGTEPTLPYSSQPEPPLPYSSQPEPPLPYPSQPYGAPLNLADGYNKGLWPPGESSADVPPPTDPYAAGPGIGFTYSDPNAPMQGYAPTSGQPYPPAPPPPYPAN